VPDSNTAIRVVIADDHFLLREGVATLLSRAPDIELIGEACNGREAIEMFVRFRPDVMLMDLQMPLMNGFDSLLSIKAVDKNARVIVLSTYCGDVHIGRALAAGASGYMLKGAMRFDLVDAVKTVYSGKKYIPSDVAAEMISHFSADSLSIREVHVLQLVAEGNSNQEVGLALALTEATIKAHMSSILAKLSAKDRTHAVTIAIRRGILI
jgi:two-component system NarL family response regulator